MSSSETSGESRSQIENPVINGPFDEPTRHFRFDDDGITDEIVGERRPSGYFVPVPAARNRAEAAEQATLDLFDDDRERIELNRFVNDVREHVGRWRDLGHPGVTATTRHLLAHWQGPDRERHLFFCQIEALETAIFLREAPPVLRPSWIDNRLDEANAAANSGLPRIAHKMATGTGKTVVAAMLIAWHTLNKAANPRDRRFADAFLVVCPGITIRDRLRVLLPSDPSNYYRVMDLVPPDRRSDLGRARIAITNFHALRQKERMAATKAAKSILASGADRASDAFTETPEQMVRRVCRDLGTNKRNIVVINDEAHHCYHRRRYDLDASVSTNGPTAPPDGADEPASTAHDSPRPAKLTAAERKEAETRDSDARMWITGLEAVQAKLGIRAAYDLSATPFYLKGSGWAEGTLFPWVVSDFSLMDAIESGLVKIPRVPVDDDTASIVPTYRHLWPHIADGLPKRRRHTADDDIEALLPPTLQSALESLYSNYREAFEQWEAQQRARRNGVGERTAPPVFIVVCANTAVSKLIYDYIAGREVPHGASQALRPGTLPLLSNVEHGQWLARPRTVLIDSVQLESGEDMSATFKRDAATEISAFKAEYEARFPGRDADKLTDEDLLREVMNTVGKVGRLGEHVRCVVSVSMLTEGWDANTVTHILGVRAFGTQLLCEQVVGRGLRRRSYDLDRTTGLLSPEYAEVYGIPFSFIPARGAGEPPGPPKPVQRVRALPERSACEITFPRVVGYKWDVPTEHLAADFGPDSHMSLGGSDVATLTEVRGALGPSEVHTLDSLEDTRRQALAFDLAKGLLDQYFREVVDGLASESPWLFPALLRVTRQWLADPQCLSIRDNAFVGLLKLHELRARAVDKIYLGIVRAEGGTRQLRPVLRPYEPVGSTRPVDFDTSRPVWATAPDRCHVNYVAADTGSWEQRMAQALEELPEVRRYVKNVGLGFTIPYHDAGQQRSYIPDFIACLDDGHGEGDLLHLVVEVTGKSDDAKAAKVAAARELWVPAVNNHGALGRWAFVEVTDPWDAHATIRGAVAEASGTAEAVAA